jgi:hypothetical protein
MQQLMYCRCCMLVPVDWPDVLFTKTDNVIMEHVLQRLMFLKQGSMFGKCLLSLTVSRFQPEGSPSGGAMLPYFVAGY